MVHTNSAKTAAAIAPQSPEIQTSDTTTSTQSPVERHLSLIKTMAIVMAVLIVAALMIIIVTIYNRVFTASADKTIQQSELLIPADGRIKSASFGGNGQILLFIENKNGQQLWQIDPAGRIWRKTRIKQLP